MQQIQQLLQKNREWADPVDTQDPEFFCGLSNQQSPRLLWIGCSDSRVPANQITGIAPGEVFVHRNVANVAAETDFNLLTYIESASWNSGLRQGEKRGRIGTIGIYSNNGSPDSLTSATGFGESKPQRAFKPAVIIKNSLQ